MRKKDEIAAPTSCLNKAADDEPIFVLRAKDIVGAEAVRYWALCAKNVHEPAKIAEALKLADEMERWRTKKSGRSVMP